MSDQAFQKLVLNALADYTMTELADRFTVSLPTIRRWATGATEPQSLMKDRITKILTEMIKARKTEGMLIG